MKSLKIVRLVEEQDRIFKVNKQPRNPYEEGSPSWNCYVDVCCSMNVRAEEGTVSLSVMMGEHEQTVEYYETYLSQLINDGILKEIKS